MWRRSSFRAHRLFSLGSADTRWALRRRRIVLSTVVLLALSSTSRPAAALDRQGSAHGGKADSSGNDDDAFDLSGSLTAGVAVYNPSYAARPDNTGLALFRYAAHGDLDLIGRKLSIPIDINLFTDSLRRGAEVLLPTEFDVISGLTSTWSVRPGVAVEGGARVEHDMPIDRGTRSQTYVDTRLRLLYSMAAIYPRLGRRLLDGDVSGWLTLGWFTWNQSYFARPDNTGFAALRYGQHVELSVWHDYVSLGFDFTWFTDRQKNALVPSELDFTQEIIVHWTPFELHLAYEQDMPVDRGGLVQRFIYALAVWSFSLRSAQPAPLEQRHQIPSP